MALQFGMLGPVEAQAGGRPVPLGHARQQCVLVALQNTATMTRGGWNN